MIGTHLTDLFIVLELFGQEEQIGAQDSQGFAGLGGFYHSKNSLLRFGQIAAGQFFLQGGEEFVMVTLQVCQKLFDNPDEQPDSAQVAHIRANVHRILALPVGIDAKQAFDLFGNTIEKGRVQIEILSKK